MGQKETAKQIWDYLVGNGWSKPAVAALLGNMQSESGIIADRWQSDIIGNMSGGYGLVQWTPATKFINWAQASGLDYKNVISQCKRIEWEVKNNQQFFCPFMTFQQFKTSTRSPEELANIFIQYYERPASINQPARAQQARYWYGQFESKNIAPRVKVLDWFNKHRGHITYDMYGSRIGTDGTADCSGSITRALYESTGIPYAYPYSTVTLSGYLERCGYKRVLVGNASGSNLNQMQDEDIILLSQGRNMAESGGAGGHTGVISGGGKLITSTCYYTQGQANTAIQDLKMNVSYLASDNIKYYEVWRPSFNPSMPTPPNQPDNPSGPSFSTNVHYSLRVLGGSWLEEVTNFNDIDSNGFAGLPYSQHDMLYIKVDTGTLRYRVHTAKSGWLGWVSKGNPKDLVNGCAGNPGEAIDGVQMYYTTPSGKVLSQGYYRSQTTARSGWLQTCCDDGTSIAGYDGWAGMMGEPLDRLQIGISTSNPFFSYYTPGINNGGSVSTNVHYSLRVLGGTWLGEVTNFNDVDSDGFAGLPNHQHDMLYVRVDVGNLRYRVHTVKSGWLGWVNQGNPNDLVNGCAGNPGEAIDGVQIYYTTPSGKTLSQSYYRSQTTARSGWLGICCDDGTSIAGYDGWAGMPGEPLDRLQLGIASDNPFYSYDTGSGSVNYPNDYPDGYPNDNTGSKPDPSVNVNKIINDSAHSLIKSMPILQPLANVTFKANQTYGPYRVVGAHLWVTTSEKWNVKPKSGMAFTIENGKLITDFDGVIKSVYNGFKGRLDYLDAANALNGFAQKVQKGAVIFSVASRVEEYGHPGVKITFQYKTKKGKDDLTTEVSFEIYFVNELKPKPIYPTTSYNKVLDLNFDRQVYFTICMSAIAGIAAVGGAAIAIFEAAWPVIFLL